MIVRELFAKLGIDVDDSAFKVADAAIEGVKKGLLGLGAVVGAARLAIVGAVKATADYSSEIHDLSAATGVGTEALQTLGYVGKLSGTSMEEMAQALVHLSRSAYEASTAGGPAGTAFYRLGVQAFDANGKVRDINALLGEVSAALGKVQNPTEKVALSLALLGRGGARVTQALGHFGNSMEEARKQAAALGVVLDEHTIEAGNSLEESIHRINFAIKGLVYAIGTPLLERTRAMVEAWVKWISENRQWIALRIDRVVMALSQATDDLVTVLKAVMNSGFRNWFIGLGLAIGAVMFPLTAFAGLLALLAQDLYLFFKDPKADTLTRDLVEGLHKLGAAIKAHGGVLGFLYDEAKEFIDFLVEQFATVPDRVAKKIPRGVMDAMMGQTREQALAEINAAPPIVRNDNWFQKMLRSSLQSVFGPPAYYGNLDEAGLQEMVKRGYTPTMSGVYRSPQMMADARLQARPVGKADAPLQTATGGRNIPQLSTSVPMREPNWMEDLVRAGGGFAPAISPVSPQLRSAEAQAPGTVLIAPQFKADIRVTSAPGADNGQIGESVRDQLDDWWGGKLSEAAAATTRGP